MSSEKLSSEEVPKKFTEWLLKMGCPAEKVPSLEKVTQMCRGQYYMVWRSLMEHVHPKDTIRHKRLNVFYDDIKICQKNKLYNKSDVVIPEQLELWRQQVELKEKVADAEARVELSRKSVKDLTDKTSIKIIQRNLLRRKLDDIQRRIWLLRLVSEELAKKKCNLDEAKKISKSMCSDSCDSDINNKLDECLLMVSKELSTPISSDMPVQEQFAKTEQLMSRLTKCGDVMWPLLHEQRVAGVTQLRQSTANNTTTDTLAQKISPYSIIALTASLHASMAMEVLKNRVLIKQVREKIAAALDEINHTLSHESCELLVLQCEIVHMETRMRTMRSICEDMAQHRGAFSTGRCDVQDPSLTMNKIYDLDAVIMDRKDEIRHMLVSLVTIEKKIFHMKECVQTIFNAFRGDSSPQLVTCGGMKLDLPEGPISALCQFYRERRARVDSKTNMSMDLDVSDVSCSDYTDENEFTFVDELKIYLRKFNLEKNRKLVLDSGEKIWIFETLQSALSRINTHWLDKNLPPLFCPSVGLPRNMQNVLDQVKERDALTHIAKRLSNGGKGFVNMDVKPIMDEEAKLTDVVKKQSAENILSLQKINKTLELSQYNLQFWANDAAKKHISANRTVDGRTYEEYEKYYLEHIIIKS